MRTQYLLIVTSLELGLKLTENCSLYVGMSDVPPTSKQTSRKKNTEKSLEKLEKTRTSNLSMTRAFYCLLLASEIEIAVKKTFETLFVVIKVIVVTSSASSSSSPRKMKML